MSPMMDPLGRPDPAGLDVAAEYRRLSAWGAGLEARHTDLVEIADQLNAWFPAAPGQGGGPDPHDFAAVALTEAYEFLWTAYETELDALSEQFLLLDVGFEVLAQAAERLGIDLDELDDEPGRPWDQDADRA